MNHLIKTTHPEWHDILHRCIACLSQEYQQTLTQSPTWLPGFSALFNAFTIPLSSTRYVLLGESPYPRESSANGYAFWDAAVGNLWNETGFSKAVNKATSLRNLMKMLLFARGDLTHDFSQKAVANVNRTRLLKTADDLFTKLIQRGFLLLNTSLVYAPNEVTYHAKQWRPFMDELLLQLKRHSDIIPIKLILFGKLATNLPQAESFSSLKAEHPYNLSFITNHEVVNFFKPMDLLYDDTVFND